MLRVAELCAGYGGLFAALQLAGVEAELAWYAEVDADACAVMEAHHSGVPNAGDITTAQFSAQEPVDIVTAGFPCTDVSCAGLRAGLMPGTRSGVWTHVARAIRLLRPQLVFLENVRGLLSARAHSNLEPCPWCVGDQPDQPVLRALGAVLGDLAELGFDAEWVTVPAAAVGAPHQRQRVFVLAWPIADTHRSGRRASVADLLSREPDTGWGAAAHPDGNPVRAQLIGVGARQHPAVAGDHREEPRGLNLLPTPTVSDSKPIGPAEREQIERERCGERAPATHQRLRNRIEALLPTPNAALGRGAGFPSAATATERYGRGTRCLDDAVALLPTPAARDAGVGAGWGEQPGRPLSETVMRLLPTPTAREGMSGPGHADSAEGTPDLRTTVTLLPTPRATDGTKGGPHQRGSSGDLMLPAAVQPDRWGTYAPAIRRWEQVLGRPAPDPTEPGRKSQPRLSARFVEWMQGLPDGYVTAHVGRNAALRLLGNGVVPLQGSYAWRLLSAALPTSSTPHLEVTR